MVDVSGVVQASPDAGSVRQFLMWMQQFSLGRKRLLDTLPAATYRQAGIRITCLRSRWRGINLARLSRSCGYRLLIGFAMRKALSISQASRRKRNAGIRYTANLPPGQLVRISQAPHCKSL